MEIMTSPYLNIAPSNWLPVTESLIAKHPLTEQNLIDATLNSWASIFNSMFGTAGFKIGTHIYPKPQIMGFLLHELIPLELESMFKSEWHVDNTTSEKDCVCVADNSFSFEIKTSSDRNKVFGNRSFSQATTKGKKAKDGYYLTVNFEKFKDSQNPKIRIIRFGWLDSSDWRGQKAATGQQSNLPPEVYAGKLKTIYSAYKIVC
ncbi:ScaI family restriction endonuclease [Candidatus Enterovibrio escicola]|uniref:ScaI family restriction endonuclease n=2 Tax=Candidatus Enterovibrio escicola TaxID=1927127 RepID=UPI001CC25370|nr:ScaI family restriction endonuclease [Candidatus Enterovibrio escacola]